MSVLDEDIEMLIDEVEKRPPLYLKALKEYSDVNLKKKLWDEVSLVLTKDWNNLSPEDKIKQGSAIQKKWHNLRSCFSRELRAQQATKSGQAASKRRKYVYYDRLLFLLPDVQQRQTTSNLEPVNEEITEEGHDNDETLDDEEAPAVTRPLPKATKKKECYEEQLLNVLKEKKKDPQTMDEEMNFVLSLVPTLKSLPEENKLQARIEILGVLQRLKFRTPTLTPTPPPQQYHQMNVIPPASSAYQQSHGSYQYPNAPERNIAFSPQSNVSEVSAKSFYSNFSENQPEGEY